MNRSTTTGIALRVGMFLLLLGGFFAAAFALPHILDKFSQVLPENYEHIIKSHIRSGQFEQAERTALKRIDQFTYDFSAHYLLAEVLGRQGKFDQAVDVIKQILAKLPAARNNSVMAIGYDEPKTYGLLRHYLWNAGRYFESGEMNRVAMDVGAPEVIFESGIPFASKSTHPEAAKVVAAYAMRKNDEAMLKNALGELGRNGTSRDEFDAALLQAQHAEASGASTTATAALVERSGQASSAPVPYQYRYARLLLSMDRVSSASEILSRLAAKQSVNMLDCRQFSVGLGGRTTTNSIQLDRNGTATAKVVTGVYRRTNLMFAARGSQAMGVFPIVSISANGSELTRIYIDKPSGGIFDLMLWPEGAPKNLELTFAFLNDEYDPVTKSDRNVQLFDLLLY